MSSPGRRGARIVVRCAVAAAAAVLVVFDALTISPGWPYLVVFGVPGLVALSAAAPQGSLRGGAAWAAAAASCIGTVAMGLSDYDYLGSWGLLETLSLLVLLVARWRSALSRRDGVLVLLAAVAVLSQPLRTGTSDLPVFTILLTAAVATAIAAGMALRAADAQRLYAVAAVRRAEREEVARELHDVVAHHVTGMLVTTEAARALLGTVPGDTARRSDEALASVEEAGREAMAAMRRMVRLLRTEDDDMPSLSPVSRLADLPALVERFRERRAAGEVHLALDDGAASVPADVQAGIVRVVHESLTNVQRHAPGTPRVSISVHHSAARLCLRVCNDLTGTAPAAGGGFGIVGMRERMAALGGTLTAGATDGAWTVAATVPLDPTSSGEDE